LTLIVLAALAGAALTIWVAAGSGKEKKQPRSAASIQGPQVRIGDVVYNVTAVRLLNRNRPTDAPYLVNKEAPPKGIAYLGVFLKLYNMNPDKKQPSAPGYLLEPTKAPGLVVMQQSSESPYTFPGGDVPPAGTIPDPTAASGPIPGALLLYYVNGKMTRAQPFRLVIHTGDANGFIILPKVPNLKTGGH
jgi:hypothetical protein